MLDMFSPRIYPTPGEDQMSSAAGNQNDFSLSLPGIQVQADWQDFYVFVHGMRALLARPVFTADISRWP